MEGVDFVGIGLIVVGALVAFKAVKGIVKLAMLLVIAAGLYLWFGVDGGLDSINPFG